MKPGPGRQWWPGPELLLDELCKPDGEYSGREGVRFVWMKDIAPEDNANVT